MWCGSARDRGDASSALPEGRGGYALLATPMEEEKSDPTPTLPRELRRTARPTIAITVVGLILFGAGFAVGVAADLPSMVALVGAVVVVLVAVAAVVWIHRVAGL